MRRKIGITGQNGFVGQHLYNTLGIVSDEFERIDFRKEYFDSESQLMTLYQNVMLSYI